MNPNLKPSIEAITTIQRKDTCIDDLFGYGAGDVENIRKLDISDDSLSNAFSQYLLFLNKDEIDYCSFIDDHRIDSVLSSKSINKFFNLANIFVGPKKDYVFTGLFVSKLIQESYDAGNNNFLLEGEFDRIQCIGSYLNGQESNPIRIHVNSNELGTGAFGASNYVIASIEGSCSLGLGNNTKNSILAIKKSANWIGDCSENLKVYVGGDCNSYFLAALDSEIIVGEKALNNPEYIRLMNESLGWIDK
jgi:hypothetical protein